MQGILCFWGVYVKINLTSIYKNTYKNLFNNFVLLVVFCFARLVVFAILIYQKKKSRKASKEYVLFWPDSLMSYTFLPYLQLQQLGLWCCLSDVAGFSSFLVCYEWLIEALGLQREVPCVCTLMNQKLGCLE